MFRLQLRWKEELSNLSGQVYPVGKRVSVRLDEKAKKKWDMQSCRSAGRKPLFILLSQSHPWRESGRIGRQATRQAGLEAANVCSQPVRVASAGSERREGGWVSFRTKLAHIRFGLGAALELPSWLPRLARFSPRVAVPPRPRLALPALPASGKKEKTRPPETAAGRYVLAATHCAGGCPLLASLALSLSISPSAMNSTNDNRGMRT